MIALQCKRFVSDIRLHKGTVVADCRSVLDLLSLGAGMGTTLKLEVSGSDAEEAMNAIVALFEMRFNEDEESSRHKQDSHS